MTTQQTILGGLPTIDVDAFPYFGEPSEKGNPSDMLYAEVAVLRDYAARCAAVIGRGPCHNAEGQQASRADLSKALWTLDQASTALLRDLKHHRNLLPDRLHEDLAEAVCDLRGQLATDMLSGSTLHADAASQWVAQSAVLRRLADRVAVVRPERASGGGEVEDAAPSSPPRTRDPETGRSTWQAVRNLLEEALRKTGGLPASKRKMAEWVRQVTGNTCSEHTVIKAIKNSDSLKRADAQAARNPRAREVSWSGVVADRVPQSTECDPAELATERLDSLAAQSRSLHE